MAPPSFQEDLISQLPELGLLHNLDYRVSPRKKRTTLTATSGAASFWRGSRRNNSALRMNIQTSSSSWTKATGASSGTARQDEAGAAQRLFHRLYGHAGHEDGRILWRVRLRLYSSLRCLGDLARCSCWRL